MKRLKNVLISAGFLLASMSSMAQVKIGDNPTTINANSVLEVESTNKGLLLPRVALTGTANVAPLAAHVAGMTVYNTATAGDVTPGYYINTGTAWSRIATGNNSEWQYDPAISSILPTRLTASGDTIAINTSTGQIVIGRSPFDPATNAFLSGSKFSVYDEKNTLSRGVDVALVNEGSETGLNNRVSGYFAHIYRGSGSVNTMFGLRGVGNVDNATGSVTSVVGLNGWALARGASVNVNTQIGIQSILTNQASGSVTNMIGLDITGNISTANASGLNRFGIRIGNVARSTYQPGGVAYAIFTNAGTVSLGDTLVLRGSSIIQGETSTTRAASPLNLNPRGGNLTLGGSMEVTNFDAGDRNSVIDFHASNAVDFNTRVSRTAGINGNFDITNTGTGSIKLSSATGSLSVLSNGDVVQTAKGYLQVATGTTAERPATAVAGMIRFNTTLVKFEGYDGTAWQLLN